MQKLFPPTKIISTANFKKNVGGERLTPNILRWIFGAKIFGGAEVYSINASIIQGSGIGPASYVVNAGDLKAVTPGNHLVKFADDTYLIVPVNNEK